jgi:hypothetical protein
MKIPFVNTSTRNGGGTATRLRAFRDRFSIPLSDEDVENLRFFTLGHGGYFSPQSFISANVPLDYRGRSGNLFYRVGGTIGLTTFTEDRTPVFANDAALQGQLQAAAASDSTINAFYAGQSKSGLTGGLRGDIEYMITPQLRIGGALRFDQAADWSETRGLVYARYRFDR